MEGNLSIKMDDTYRVHSTSITSQGDAMGPSILATLSVNHIRLKGLVPTPFPIWSLPKSTARGSPHRRVVLIITDQWLRDNPKLAATYLPLHTTRLHLIVM